MRVRCQPNLCASLSHCELWWVSPAFAEINPPYDLGPTYPTPATLPAEGWSKRIPRMASLLTAARVFLAAGAFVRRGATRPPPALPPQPRQTQLPPPSPP